MRLIEVIKIQGKIILETGLHIGGSKTSLDIGGLDSPVIKTPLGVPYIPGSSLKGKMRSLLGLNEGCGSIEEDTALLKKMFGFHGNEKKMQPAVLTRLICRDAHMNGEAFHQMFTQNNALLETDYTSVKFENVIDRKKGTTITGGLRQIERVPAGAEFDLEMILNIFDEDNRLEMVDMLKKGLKLIETNYLGGSGTRGYGKVKIQVLSMKPVELKTNEG